jgi:hypothetical protein
MTGHAVVAVTAGDGALPMTVHSGTSAGAGPKGTQKLPIQLAKLLLTAPRAPVAMVGVARSRMHKGPSRRRAER